MSWGNIYLLTYVQCGLWLCRLCGLWGAVVWCAEAREGEARRVGMRTRWPTVPTATNGHGPRRETPCSVRCRGVASAGNMPVTLPPNTPLVTVGGRACGFGLAADQARRLQEVQKRRCELLIREDSDETAAHTNTRHGSPMGGQQLSCPPIAAGRAARPSRSAASLTVNAVK